MAVLNEGLSTTLLSTVLDFVSGAKKAGKDIKTFMDKGNKPSSASNYLKGSISNYAQNLILTFPVMCDDTLPASTMSMISRANERNIITMLEMLFASMQFNGTNGAEILSMIHKNIKTNYSLDDAIDIVGDFIDKKGLNESVSEVEIATVLRAMTEQLKLPQKSFPVNSLSESSLNEYTVLNIQGRTVVKEAHPTDKDNLDYAKTVQDMEIGRRDDERRDHQAQYAAKDDKRKDDQEARNAEKHPGDMENLNRRNLDLQIGDMQKQLLDVDVKKANEMQPTLMVVKFNEFDNENRYQQGKAFIAGVKSRVIAIEGMDIVERLVTKQKNKVNFLNIIRALTGEIKLVSDLFLCLKQAKIDAKNEVKKGPAAKMWKVLEARSIKNAKNRSTNGNDASAITTLVINQETVNFMKKQYDFDIEKISNAKMILDAYNLLGIIIADESIDVVKFLYAGNDMYEQQAYSFIEKESNDNSYKKVINLLGKTNNGR